jgi:hypothetical protein
VRECEGDEISLHSSFFHGRPSFFFFNSKCTDNNGVHNMRVYGLGTRGYFHLDIPPPSIV